MTIKYRSKWNFSTYALQEPISEWMHEKKSWKTLACGLLALTLTVSCYFLDQYTSEVHESNAALQWARQIIGQTESMQLSARVNGEKDTLTWAVNYLAQGVEPRVMKISRLAATPEFLKSGTNETYQLNRSTGTFDYVRILNAEDGSGVRITLDLRTAGITRGFLGTHSRLAEDLALAAVFLISTFFSWKTLTHSRRKSEMEIIKATPNIPSTQLASIAPQRHTSPAPELKTSISALGLEIRELVKQAHAMVVTTKESQKATEGIKDKIYSSLNQLHSNRKMLKEATELATQAEAMVDNVGQELDQTELLSLLAKIKEVSVQNERIFRELEIQIEPCLMDVDLAAEAYQNSISTTEKMGEQIQKTKEKLISHVRVVQSSGTDNAA
jgi:uncharacterized protein with GYD domain